MASNKTSVRSWQSIVAHEQVEIGLVHVAITYHRQSDSDPFQLEELKDLLRDCFQTVAEHWGGKLFSWDRHGGAFMFLVEDRERYDHCCLAAIQMLEMIPSLDQDLRSSTDQGCRVKVRIACDCGMVDYDPDPANIPVDFAKNLANCAKDVTTENRVTITDRIYGQLTPQCQPRFQSWKHSTALDAELYRTAQSHEAASPHASPVSPQSPTSDAGKTRLVADATPVTEKRPAKRPGRGRRRPAGRMGPWQVAVIGLVCLLIGEFFVVRALLPPAPPAATMAATGWDEQVRSPEWLAWRKGVHEILSSPQLTEETLAEALRVKRPEIRTPPSAVLRHDQEIGDVLQSYPAVRRILQARLGIYPEFLGTGYSNPVHALDYEGASLHEYLIPNLDDTDARVWMRKIKTDRFVEAFNKTIKDLIDDKTDDKTDEQSVKKGLKQTIITHAESGDKATVMVRFAILDEKGQYKGSLGHHSKERVFACDLAEVWKLKIQEAAERSGYLLSQDQKYDTLFIWVFVPVTKREAVPATWGEVLEHLPEWMEAAQRRP